MFSNDVSVDHVDVHGLILVLQSPLILKFKKNVQIA